MDDREFLEAFEACRLDEFHHRDHVRVAWLYLRSHPLLMAIDKFSTGLKRFAASRGKSEIYHETITWAYLLLIHERIARDGAAGTWDAFAAAHPDLLTWSPSILERYYLKATLDSDVARRTFVLPDLRR
jgi:hypothetical protein